MKKALKRRSRRGGPFISGRSYLGRPPKGAKTARGDIILRKSWFFLDKGKVTYPVPEVTLLATGKGFAWLSKFFTKWARMKNPDEDAHDHLGWPMAPLDCRHSDEIEIRVAMITPENKRKLFKKYGITARSACRGDLRDQYIAQLRNVEADLKKVRRMKQQLAKR